MDNVLVALSPGTADQLADRLEQLADYGDSKNPLTDSVLSDAVASARRYISYLRDEFGPQAGGIIIRPGTSVYATADALAQMIIDEGGAGADEAAAAAATPGATGVPTWPWWAWAGVAAAAAGVGWYAFAFGVPKRGRGRRAVLA